MTAHPPLTVDADGLASRLERLCSAIERRDRLTRLRDRYALTVDEVADALSVSRSHVYESVRKGLLPPFRKLKGRSLMLTDDLLPALRNLPEG